MSMVTAAPHKSLATHPDFAPASERPYEWRDDARCKGADPHAFFGVNDPDPYTEALCHSCTVRDDCLADALARRDLDDFRAGLTPVELRRAARRPRQGKLRVRDCEFCGEAFPTRSNSQRYCGPVCRGEGMRRKWRMHKQAVRA